ncbi:FBD-associated F-box protein At5g38590-like [Prunus dulcis]|uniref:FBD-associated F-box protein At5g38590-like n=2 Tax=Prunus dulcis TaxID=3755 RepID=UPI0014829D39|nr:FBD-associated F-box protein At5g38590-like [Prunus dulcis]
MPKRKAKRSKWTYGKRIKLPINLGDKGETYSEVDRISQLPDAILISILSLLSIREAARTCFLSKRWIYVWKQVTCLNFYDIDALYKPLKKRGQTTPSYNWVNQVLQMHQCPSLDAFRFCSSSTYIRPSSSEIDNWIEFGMQKRVQRLEIDLEAGRLSPFSYASYIFPDKPFRSPFGVSCIKSLKHLSLSFVNITGELVEHFLSNCELLEHLCVSCSDQLVTLKVAGSSLRLKFLQISDCMYLEKIEICAPNLVSFIYHGMLGFYDSIRLRHAPLLVNVSLAESTRSIVPTFLSVKSCLPQLVTLNLNLHMNLNMSAMVRHPEFPELTCLKDLTLNVVASDRQSLLNLTKLIERSPFLHRFTLDLRWARVPCLRNLQKVNKCPHQCLKVVKFSGFVGSSIDTELAMYFTENAVALETFLVDLRKVVVEESTLLSEFVTTQKQLRAARKRALQIGKKLPPGTELIVL